MTLGDFVDNSGRPLRKMPSEVRISASAVIFDDQGVYSYNKGQTTVGGVYQEGH